MAGAAAVASILGTVMGYEASREAASDTEAAAREAERIGRENAAAIEAETQETIRRTELEQSATEARARTVAAASGTVGGSLETVIGTMESEHERQLGWIQTSGESRERIAISAGTYAGMTGMAQASAIQAQGVASLFAGVGTTFTAGSRAGWWS